jgi:hypothetical protein
MEENNLLLQLQKQMLSFLDDLIESYPDETDFYIFRLFIDQVPIVDIMKYITTKLCPLRPLIEKKDEKFFLENNVLFNSFGNTEMSKVDHFRELWLSNSMTVEDKTAIWKWFDLFVTIGNKYIELKKKAIE